MSERNLLFCGCSRSGQHHASCPVMLEFDRIERENAAMREAIGEAHVFIERHTYSDHSEDCLTMCGPDAECDCGQFKERRETLSKLQPFLKP